jgi:hypothetical protein
MISSSNDVIGRAVHGNDMTQGRVCAAARLADRQHRRSAANELFIQHIRLGAARSERWNNTRVMTLLLNKKGELRPPRSLGR